MCSKPHTPPSAVTCYGTPPPTNFTLLLLTITAWSFALPIGNNTNVIYFIEIRQILPQLYSRDKSTIQTNKITIWYITLYDILGVNLIHFQHFAKYISSNILSVEID